MDLTTRRDALASIGERQLLWIDVDRAFDGAIDRLRTLDGAVSLRPRDVAWIEADTARARFRQAQDRWLLTLEALEGDAADLTRREIDLIAAPGVVLTVHDGSLEALDRFRASYEGETALGALSAADLLSSIVDEVIAGYHLIVEALEREIDELDARALRGRSGDDLLRSLVDVRHRLSLVRRTLAPHRVALAALARPELQTEDGIGQPWPGLVTRVEGAIDAVEGLRDALLGTYDIHMGRVAQRANDVMRILTLLSAVLLPAVVLAGVMGMNFQIPFFDDAANFTVVLISMAGLAGLILLVARWRRWL